MSTLLLISYTCRMDCLRFAKLLCLLLLSQTCSGLDSDECSLMVSDRKALQINIPVNESLVVCLNVSDLQFSATHVVFQAHVYNDSVVLSLDSRRLEGRFLKGSDVGVVSVLTAGDAAKWYLRGSLSYDTKVIVMATAYGAKAPVPGGCNLEFTLKNDPNVYLSSEGAYLNAVEFAYGDYDSAKPCGASPIQSNVSYDVYQFFMDEGDLSAGHYYEVIGNLLDPGPLTKNAVHVSRLAYNDNTRLKFPAYRGIGTVFVVVMTVTHDNGMATQASYVPMVTYSCDDLSSGCPAENEFESKIVLTVLAAFGLFICFCGHRFFKTEMFFFGFLAALLTAYILLERFSSLDFVTRLYVSLGVGGFGGIVWLLVWVFVGVPLISIQLPICLLGYVVACIVFTASPLGLVLWLQLDPEYHIVFFGIVLLVMFLIAFSLRMVNVLACSFVGSFFIILVSDICLRGAVQYVLLNTIHRSSIPSFVRAFCILPVQFLDIQLYVAWSVIAFIGLVVHYFLERNRPPFPDCPWESYKRSRETRRRLSDNSETTDDFNERSPLLTSSRPNPEEVNRTWRQQPVEQFSQPQTNTTEWWQVPTNPDRPSALPAVSHIESPPPPYEE